MQQNVVKKESAGHAAGYFFSEISNKIATTENVLTAEHHIHIPELSSAEDSNFFKCGCQGKIFETPLYLISLKTDI